MDSAMMLTGPIPATRTLLERNRMAISDLDLIEINEAFASVVLARQRALNPTWTTSTSTAARSPSDTHSDRPAARLITTLLHELERSHGELGLVTMCTAGGTGTGTLIQRI